MEEQEENETGYLFSWLLSSGQIIKRHLYFPFIDFAPLMKLDHSQERPFTNTAHFRGIYCKESVFFDSRLMQKPKKFMGTQNQCAGGHTFRSENNRADRRNKVPHLR
jgi:hypothetical protein